MEIINSDNDIDSLRLAVRKKVSVSLVVTKLLATIIYFWVRYHKSNMAILIYHVIDKAILPKSYSKFVIFVAVNTNGWEDSVLLTSSLRKK